jgi:hypothetical protein
MRQFFVGLVAAAALVASQNSAQAVLVKVLIDDFDAPPASTHGSTPGGTPFSPLTGSSLAETRTLYGRAVDGLVPAALTAGSGELNIALAANESATLRYDFADAPGKGLYDEFADPVLILTGLTMTSGSPLSSLMISVVDNFGFYTSGTYFASQGTTDFSLAGPFPISPVSFLEFTFTAGAEGFIGETQGVVANPEPATMALMGLGVVGGAIGYRRRRKEDEVAPSEA